MNISVDDKDYNILPGFLFCQSWYQNIHQQLHMHMRRDEVGFCKVQHGGGQGHGMGVGVQLVGQGRWPQGQRQGLAVTKHY